MRAIEGKLIGNKQWGEKVTLVGFGGFQVMERKAKRGVNPQTREAIQIPAKKVPKFALGKGLRKKVE